MIHFLETYTTSFLNTSNKTRINCIVKEEFVKKNIEKKIPKGDTLLNKEEKEKEIEKK